MTSWYLCKEIYPPAEEIALALQDAGKMNKVKRKGREVNQHKFPLMEKLARKMYSAIQTHFHNPEGLTKNVSRGSQGLYKEIVLLRKHVDVTETASFFHQYGKDGKVYLISNHPSNSGVDIAVKCFQEAIDNAVKQKNTARTSNDGLRVACILLDPCYRDSVSGIMSKKKSRTKSDITGDPTTHFFEKVNEECFANPDYFASPPNPVYFNQFPEDEKAEWDPNHPSIFEHSRSGEWLRETWEGYVRPKYKKALDKWNKDTGGGDGTPPSFIDYCAGDRWLVYIFCKDIEANNLLGSNACGRMPNHLQLEAGFTCDDHSSLTGGSGSRSGSGGDSTVSKRRLVEVEVEESKRYRTEVLDTVREYLQQRKEEREQEREQEAAETADHYLRQVADYSQMMGDKKVLDTMSPNTRERYVRSLKKQRKTVLTKLDDSQEE